MMLYERKEVIGDAVLYLGDCRDVLPMIGKVDALITDPPYEKEAHAPMQRTNESIKTGKNASIDFDAINEDMRLFVAEQSNRINDGWMLAFCQVEASSLWRDVVIKSNGKYRRTMVWVKPDSSPQFNGQGPAQGYECISASWFGEGASKWNSGGKRGVYTHLCNHGRYGGHPTEKPVSLMEELIGDFVPAHGLILDPFMGSGTTGVAAMNLKRKFIGIEREEKYFEIACRRIEDAQRQGGLF